MKDGKYLIGLDAGHGGSDAGALSVIPNLTESMLTLELTKMIRDRLVNTGKFEVVMSREDNTSPGNASSRGILFGKMKCDFALSVHFNAFNLESANGTECYVPNQEQYAKIEYNFKTFLTKYFKERVPYCKGKNYSDGSLNTKYIDDSTLKFKEVYPSQNYFGFIREAWKYGVSADLIEICFITNKKDLQTYLDNQENIADDIAKAICLAYGVEFEPTVPNPPTGIPDNLEVEQLRKEIETLQNKLNMIKEIIS